MSGCSSSCTGTGGVAGSAALGGLADLRGDDMIMGTEPGSWE